jgi:hypothetical protein
MSQSTNLEFTENTNGQPPKSDRLITATYNIIGIGVGLFGLFSENKNGIIALLMYPLLGIAVVLLGKGRIKFISDDKSRIFGSINIGFLFTSLFLVFKSADDYTIFQTPHIWLPFVIISLTIASALYMAGVNPFASKSRTDAIIVLIIGLIYSYGSTRQINCAFDYSTPQIYNAVIIDHREHTGRHSAYYLTLTAWGSVQQVNEQEVDGWLYDNVKIGDTVKVNFRQGLLKAPWFVITKN